MLRAALIGFGSAGKTTLFELMTSAKDPGRAAHARAEASIGMSIRNVVLRSSELSIATLPP